MKTTVMIFNSPVNLKLEFPADKNFREYCEKMLKFFEKKFRENRKFCNFQQLIVQKSFWNSLL